MGKKDRADVSAEVATVTLTNIGRQPLVFSLPHNTYCGEGPCACTDVVQTVFDYDYATGEHTQRVVDRKICSSDHLFIRETKVFDARVMNISDIKTAVNRGDLLVA